MKGVLDANGMFKTIADILTNDKDTLKQLEQEEKRRNRLEELHFKYIQNENYIDYCRELIKWLPEEHKELAKTIKGICKAKLKELIEQIKVEGFTEEEVSNFGRVD